MGRELFLLVYVHGYLAVPDIGISIGWFHAFSYSLKPNRNETIFLFTISHCRFVGNDDAAHHECLCQSVYG